MNRSLQTRQAIQSAADLIEVVEHALLDVRLEDGTGLRESDGAVLKNSGNSNLLSFNAEPEG